MYKDDESPNTATNTDVTDNHDGLSDQSTDEMVSESDKLEYDPNQKIVVEQEGVRKKVTVGEFSGGTILKERYDQKLNDLNGREKELEERFEKLKEEEEAYNDYQDFLSGLKEDPHSTILEMLHVYTSRGYNLDDFFNDDATLKALPQSKVDRKTERELQRTREELEQFKTKEQQETEAQKAAEQEADFDKQLKVAVKKWDIESNDSLIDLLKTQYMREDNQKTVEQILDGLAQTFNLKESDKRENRTRPASFKSTDDRIAQEYADNPRALKLLRQRAERKGKAG